MGLSDEEEAFPELLPMGDFDLKNLKKLRGPSCNIMEIGTTTKTGTPTPHENKSEKPRSRKGTKKEQETMKEKHVYPKQFYKAKEEDIAVDHTLASKDVKGKKIARWTIEDEDLVKNLNLGTPEYPKLVKIAKDLGEYKGKVKELLLKFKDVFAFTYKDMKGIPPHICEHEIELQPEAKPVRQMRYRMNPNYATKVKEEIDKYLGGIKQNCCHQLRLRPKRMGNSKCMLTPEVECSHQGRSFSSTFYRIDFRSCRGT